VEDRRGSTVAFIAALVLVLQSFLSVWAAGAFAATSTLDTFGNQLCITSGDHHGTTPQNDHSRMPDCCAFGCGTTSPLLADAPGDGIGLPRPLSADDLRFDLIEAFLTRGPDHDPGSPRAPPPTA
jgi:hypothetical protein